MCTLYIILLHLLLNLQQKGIFPNKCQKHFLNIIYKTNGILTMEKCNVFYYTKKKICINNVIIVNCHNLIKLSTNKKRKNYTPK